MAMCHINHGDVVSRETVAQLQRLERRVRSSIFDLAGWLLPPPTGKIGPANAPPSVFFTTLLKHRG